MACSFLPPKLCNRKPSILWSGPVSCLEPLHACPTPVKHQYGRSLWLIISRIRYYIRLEEYIYHNNKRGGVYYISKNSLYALARDSTCINVTDVWWLVYTYTFMQLCMCYIIMFCLLAFAMIYYRNKSISLMQLIYSICSLCVCARYRRLCAHSIVIHNLYLVYVEVSKYIWRITRPLSSITSVTFVETLLLLSDDPKQPGYTFWITSI